ncbi:MAG: hypothetical protein ABIC95_01595 [archaeon]
MQLVQEARHTIPVQVLHAPLSPLSCLVKYLKENRGLSFAHIAKLLKRSYRAVWGAYERAKSAPKLMDEVRAEFFLSPNDFVADLSILESVVSHLKDHHGLTFAVIATLIDRDQRTVWTVYDRARKKGDAR